MQPIGNMWHHYNMKSLRFFLFFIICAVRVPAYGCFILFNSDGKQILIANHEDWFREDAAIRIIPPANGNFGSITFTFLSEGWAQGGMNEQGLFFDAAMTPFQEIEFDPGVAPTEG